MVPRPAFDAHTVTLQQTICRSRTKILAFGTGKLLGDVTYLQIADHFGFAESETSSLLPERETIAAKSVGFQLCFESVQKLNKLAVDDLS